jgi:aspartyl-tRNA(Asn)/glutamyl-tRNA(Gln) amidotransferase subunit B
MNYEPVIGLEVHVQVRTASKMFCGCRNEYGGAVNSHTCPVCLGMPGVLPVPNLEAIRKTIHTGLLLDCDIAPYCKFDRKSYFYPDMPKNYQISQYDLPLCLNGGVTLDKFAFPKEVQKDPMASANKRVRLERIHLEEDVAKSTHFDTTSGIDFNRAGTPLMEIVTRADIRSPEEAFAFLATLRQILVQGGISDADMEKGQMRCDCNVSVRPEGREQFGTKVEIKNMNSISGVRRALAYEIERQIECVRGGGVIVQETRRWDDPTGQTFTMRTKEKAHDYRYFPDPDLMPIRTDLGLLEEVRPRVQERPHERRERYERDFGVTDYDASVLASDLELAAFFEKAAAGVKNPKAVANWMLNDLLSQLSATETALADCRIEPGLLHDLVLLVESGKINGKQAKEVFAEMFATGKAPAVIVEEKGMSQVSDAGALEEIARQVIAANPKQVEEYRSGKTSVINFLKGQAMKLSKGKANPQAIGEALEKLLA